MTKKQVWRYACDFCGKKSLSSGHMKTHEKHCTANPNRECRMCKHFCGDGYSVAGLSALLDANAPPDYGLLALREKTDGCPMCMLAAIRQSGICKWDTAKNPHPVLDLPFNFRKEVADFWAEENAQREQDREERYAAY